jgi:hypothetical protein
LPPLPTNNPDNPNSKVDHHQDIKYFITNRERPHQTEKGHQEVEYLTWDYKHAHPERDQRQVQDYQYDIPEAAEIR